VRAEGYDISEYGLGDAGSNILDSDRCACYSARV